MIRKGHHSSLFGHLALSFILLASLNACEKNPVSEQDRRPIPSDIPIAFGTRTSVETKGQHPLISYDLLADQRFSVSAWYTPEGEFFSPSSVCYFQNHQFGTLDKDHFTLWQGTIGSGAAEAADPVYYPLDGTLSYFCYAPYRSDVTSDESDVKIIYAPESSLTDLLPNYLPGSPILRFKPSNSVSDLIDFIAAKPMLDVDRHSGAVELDFTEHMTTAIEFHVKYQGAAGAVGPSEVITVPSISLRNVIGAEYMYYTLSGGILGRAWSSNVPPDGAAEMPRATYTLTSSDLKGDNLDTVTPLFVNNTLNGRLYLLPQVLPPDSYLDITYNVKAAGIAGTVLDENIVSFPLYGTQDWPQGKKIIYTITITIAKRSEVAITNVQVVDWTDSNNNHDEQEITF